VKARRRWLQQLLGAAAAAACGTSVRAAPGDARPPMHRGLNLTHWFEYDRSQVVRPAELRELRSLGFDHVRLPLDPLACGWRVAEPARLPFAQDLQQTVEQVLAAELTLVLDLHLEPSDKASIEQAAQGRAALVALWSALARMVSQAPVPRLALELFNEPQFHGSASPGWAPFQRQMLQAVREHAPAHTVLLTGHQGSSIEGLQRLKPLADKAAAYVFHYYSPYLFTHQGAHWMETRYTTAGLHRDVRYPASLQAGRPLQLSQPHPRAADELQRYVAERWAAERIHRELSAAALWARTHGVPVVCNEFGVLRAAADPASRYRWIGDVRRSLETLGIGWTLWDYAHIFGITETSSTPPTSAPRRIEPLALAALGRPGPG
jgi:endoglucanase